MGAVWKARLWNTASDQKTYCSMLKGNKSFGGSVGEEPLMQKGPHPQAFLHALPTNCRGSAACRSFRTGSSHKVFQRYPG
ncbi:MAG: hypothetical protein BCS36_07965 [Desulfovibrio sp. MES5]|nr:MAG: hypothetical protein BCS36_07965 [Desulfovibrio sp. MES5]